jgi:20S proteasome alpha/beta subunit
MMTLAGALEPEAPKTGRQKMTVCIAATCEINTGPKIILCTDWQVSSELGFAQTAFKQHHIKPGWFCLYSGDPSASQHLIRLLRRRFVLEADISEINILKLIQTCLFERKRFLCEEFSQSKFAMPYEEFLNSGKDKLPLDRYTSAVRGIEALPLGVDCIICGFIEGFPILVQTDQFCGATIRESFAVVGAGSYLAHASLMHRQHDELGLLDASIYCVYEAKKWAERNRTVGDHTSVTVVSANGNAQLLTAKGKLFLDEKFGELGPKPVPFNLKNPPESLSPYAD